MTQKKNFEIYYIQHHIFQKKKPSLTLIMNRKFNIQTANGIQYYQKKVRIVRLETPGQIDSATYRHSTKYNSTKGQLFDILLPTKVMNLLFD